MNEEKTLSSEYFYKGKIMNLRVDKVECPGGRISTREVCEHCDGVAILPVDEDGSVTLVRQFRYPFAKELLEVSGDAVKLTQVIYNVIDNAIKYTPRGGEDHISLNKSGKRAIIRISDTGIGIPAADLPHVFDRFYRVDKARSRATGGTGLGLSIVKQIVLLHGGNITATSEEGKGTTFTIDLPLSIRKDKSEKEA